MFCPGKLWADRYDIACTKIAGIIHARSCDYGSCSGSCFACGSGSANGETDGESTNYQKVNISGKASPLPDDQLDLVIGSDEAEKDEEMKLLIENFYKAVQFLPEGALASNE